MKSISSLTLMLIPVLTIYPGKAQTRAQPVAKAESPKSADQDKNIQDYVSLLRAHLRQRKTDVMSAVMQLDADDAAKFWPIYRDFEAELKQIYDQVGSEIRNYAAKVDSMTDPVADQIGTKILNLEEQRNSMKRRYYVRFKTALDPIVAMRFLQVENQIERIIDLQIASELPIVQRSQP